jgi:sulfur carrier protein
VSGLPGDQRATQTILVNGRARPVPPDGTLAAVLVEAGLDGRPVAIEVDGRVVPRSRFAESSLTGGERIEIVTFVGGG